ncbi:hypothetical protein AAY473_024282 [Plecturocebus cupreus]
MCDTCPLYQRQKVVDLLMKQSLKSQANCPTSLCCCSSGIHTSCLQPAIFQMWLLKESSMGYFTLIYSPGMPGPYCYTGCALCKSKQCHHMDHNVNSIPNHSWNPALGEISKN